LKSSIWRRRGVMGRVFALVKREVRETYWKRKTGLFIQLATGMVLVPTALYPMLRLADASGPAPAHSLLLGIFPVFIIVAVGVPFVVEHFYKDKLRRNTEVLLCLGFSPLEIWSAKIAAAGAFSLGSYALGVILCLGWLKSHGQSIPPLTRWAALNLLMLSPLLGIAMLGVKGVLHFLLSDIRLLNIAFVLPFVLLFIFMGKVLGLLGVASVDDRGISIALAAASACLFSLSTVLLKSLHRERWL
jgi:ABC-type Na+ efflux pump permease subunit